jgi:hypothetical protein
VPAHFARACRLIGRVLPAPTLAYCLGRDGSATAKRDGQWLAGCSVPKRAAEQMFRKENWSARTLCLLVPTHGQQIAVILEKLGPTRALIVLQPCVQTLTDILASVDLTGPLVEGRLYFADDEAAVDRLFAANPGLAVPSQMVRTADADGEAVARAIAWAQPAFSRHAAEQGKRIHAAVTRPATTGPLLLVGGAFRLWNDVGQTLASVVGDVAGFRTLDTDRPTSAAEAYQIEQAAEATAILSDRPRPVWANVDRPWITWLTKPAIPAFNPTFSRDALLLTDGSWIAAARNTGWPANRVAVANWPSVSVQARPGAPLSLIADLPSLEVPADVAEWSVWQLSWEAMRDELTKNPFALGDDATKYVRRAPARLGLTADETYPVDRFVTDLVAPAYTLGIARWLAEKKVDFTLHGRGWQDEPALANHYKGPLNTRESFFSTLNSSAGLIESFFPGSHPVRAIAAPRVATFGRTSQRILQDIASIANVTPQINPASALSASLVRELL